MECFKNLISLFMFVVLGKFVFAQNSKDIKIGNQTWMIMNLSVEKFRNGDFIPQAISNEEWKEAADNRQPAWCYFNNNKSNETTFGKLYNWYAVIDPRGLAPIGYHVPSKKEWANLVTFLGGDTEAGAKLKTVGTVYWSSPNSWSSNSSGFSARACGARYVNSISTGGPFNQKDGIHAYFWTTSPYPSIHSDDYAFGASMYYTNPGISISQCEKASGFSVRCIKDEVAPGWNAEPDMLRVNGGSFIMGSDVDYENAKPIHYVTIDDFAISKFEITQAQWLLVMGYSPEVSKKYCERCPVLNVSWKRAQEFVQALSAQTGKRYRLPTEAEWEFAASGGVMRADEGDESNRNTNVGWSIENSNAVVHQVGMKQPNLLGIYDMFGNASEWCIDWFNEYLRDSLHNPYGPEDYSGGAWTQFQVNGGEGVIPTSEPFKVLRGGNFGSPERFCSVSCRDSGSYNYGSSEFTGLRVVLDVKFEDLKKNNEMSRKKAWQLYLEKDYQASLELINGVLRSDSPVVNDYYIKGVNLIKFSDYDGAIKVLKEGLEHFPQNWNSDNNLRRVYISIGWSLLLEKKYTLALKYLKDGYELYPDDIYIKGNLAHAHLLCGETEKARKIYIQNKGKNLSADLSWNKMVSDDFSVFIKIGIENIHFQEILNQVNK
jgi:uncharacterized protein (TIGR02145 family)